MRYQYIYYDTPGEACRWVVRGLRSFSSQRSGVLLSEMETQTLLLPMPVAFAQLSREDLTALNNRTVHVLRCVLTYESSSSYRKDMKKRGRTASVPFTLAPLVQMRPGLKIPGDWAETFDLIIRSNAPVVVSGVIQNAINFNPQAGESSPWKMPAELPR